MTEIAWAEFEQKLRAYVRRRVPHSVVDDVVSDILLRLVRSQNQLQGANNPMAWIYRVASNVIVDYYRKNESQQRMLDGVLQDDTDQDTTAEDIRSLASCLKPMIKRLPAPYDEALMLIDIDGTSQVAAAEQLGLSVSGMKSRVQRGRKKLKSSILDCCDVTVNQRGDVIEFEQRDTPSACSSGRCH